MQYFNQILTAVLEVLDDSESLTRELALSLILEMLKNQVCWLSFQWSLVEFRPLDHPPFSKLRGAVVFYTYLTFSLSIINVLFQINAMEDSVEIIIEKLLHVTKDDVAKVNFRLGLAESIVL